VLVVQFIEGFNSAIEQVKVVVGHVNFDAIDPFKEVVNGEIVEVVD